MANGDGGNVTPFRGASSRVRAEGSVSAPLTQVTALVSFDQVKTAMDRAAVLKYQEALKAASELTRLAPRDPDYLHPNAYQKLNEIMTDIITELRSAIAEANSPDELQVNLKGVAHYLLRIDAADHVNDPEESLAHSLFTHTMQAGIAMFEKAGSSLNGQANQLSTVLGKYHADFLNLAGQQMQDHSKPITFAHPGIITPDEFRACIHQSAYETYCYFYSPAVSDNEKDQIDQQLDALREAIDEEPNDDNDDLVARLKKFVDESIAEDFDNEVRDAGESPNYAWAAHFLAALESKIQTNALPESTAPLSEFEAARKRKIQPSLHNSVDHLQKRLTALQRYHKQAEEVIDACDMLVAQGCGIDEVVTAHAALASRDGSDLEAFSGEDLESLEEEARNTLLEYVQDHFFNRVTARGITLGYDYDASGAEIPYPLHTYFLLAQAYATARATIPHKLPEGSKPYYAALERQETDIFTKLAKSGSWQCATAEDFLNAHAILVEQIDRYTAPVQTP